MAKIAVFDSGVGGLTIFQSVQQLCPDESYFFVSDSQAHPYGNKPADELISRVVDCTRRIINYFKPDILVLACNTASTVVLPTLREEFSLPIVGVVPAIKPAAAHSLTGKIALLATPATVARSYTQQLIDDFAGKCDVLRVGSSAMVQIVEDKLAGIQPDLSVLTYELQPIIDYETCDVIILACTHFPILNKEIEGVLNLNNRSCLLLDSGRGVANQVRRIVDDMAVEKPTESVKAENSRVAAFTHGAVKNLVLRNNILDYGFDQVIGLEV